MKKYTQIIADYLSDLKYENIPDEVIERAKLVTLHTIGAAIAAVKTEAGKNIISVAKELGTGGKEATIIGEDQKSALETPYSQAELLQTF